MARDDVEVNTEDEGGRSPLSYAAELDDVEVATIDWPSVADLRHRQGGTRQA